MTLRAVPVAVAHFAGAETLWTLWMSVFADDRSGACPPRKPGEVPRGELAGARRDRAQALPRQDASTSSRSSSRASW